MKPKDTKIKARFLNFHHKNQKKIPNKIKDSDFR